MAKTIVVTGARGFIGAVAVRRLAATPDTSVVALARARDGAPDLNVHWIESRLEDLRPAHWAPFASAPIDALIHLAAFTPKSAATRDCAHEIIAANIVGTQALLASLPHPPRRFIFCSTLDIYARQAFEHTVDELSPVGPAGLYGASKLFGEVLAESYARSSGTEHLTLRLGHIYGPGEERYAKLVPATIRRLLSGQPPRIAGDGSEQRDLLYVDDLVEALTRACTVPLGDTHTINVARGESHSILDVINTIATLADYRSPHESLPPSADAYSTVFDTSLMKRVLGTWTFVPLAEGLKREIAHFKSAS